MKFQKFAKYLEQLEKTSKRLEITDILTDLISQLDDDEIDKGIYLASGQLGAAFEGIKFNIAEKLMIKIIDQTFSTPKDNVLSKINTLYRKNGDLGNVVYELKDSEDKSGISVSEVYDRLFEITQITGNGSQESKANKTAALLKELDSLSAKYVTRIILDIMRLGFTELTIIAALANLLEDKKLAKEIESRFYIYPDIGFIAKKVKTKGMKGIEDIKVETGVPILSQKCQRVSGIEEIPQRIKNMWAEFKFDGTRIQMHFDKGKKPKSKNAQEGLFIDEKENFMVKTFTRNLEETTHQYPDIIEAAEKYIKADSAILDGEGIGYDKKTGRFLHFQETIQRKRKYDIAQTAKDIPFKYYVFDLLYLNGESLMDKTLKERKEILRTVVADNDIITVDSEFETTKLQELKDYFNLAKSKGLEGLVVKTPEDTYHPGARSYSWVKYKTADEKLLSDSFDCVVLGYYSGRGVRSKFGIGGFLVGVYDINTDSYKTISKIGTGLTEEDWQKLKSMCDKIRLKEKPSNVEMDKIFKPAVYVKPEIVVEIGADEISKSPTHTAGYALRFPRLLNFRDDKSPTDATTVDEIVKMYQGITKSKNKSE